MCDEIYMHFAIEDIKIVLDKLSYYIFVRK